MAVWQASFHLVPHQRVAELFPGSFDPPFGPDYVASLPSEDAADLEWWGDLQPPMTLRTELARLAPPIPTWSSDVEWWGTEDGNRFDVYSVAGRVEALYVRFDMRKPSKDFMTAVARLAVAMSCDFLAGAMLYEGTLAGLAVGLRNSAALRFVEDPIAFLENVGLDHRMDDE